jgi:hypothetical protein
MMAKPTRGNGWAFSAIYITQARVPKYADTNASSIACQ